MIQMTLNMTEREAEALMTLCCNIHGDPRGPRGFFDKLSGALDRVGVDTDDEFLCGNVYPTMVDEWPGEQASLPTVTIQRFT